MEFSYKEIEHIIRLLKNEGYTFSQYYNYDKNSKTVILRHDVDISIEQALEMAKVENNLGVSSTYFIMVRGDFYNPFNTRNAKMIKQICELGHDVGLHFDETLYKDTGDLPEYIKREVDILGRLLDIKIKSVSMHIPSKKTLESNYIISGGNVVNSYSNEFFKNFKYVSDSKMHWREDVYDIINSGKYSHIHLLTHPVWYHEEDNCMWDNVAKVLCKQVENAYEDFTVHTVGVDNPYTISECVGELYD